MAQSDHFNRCQDKYVAYARLKRKLVAFSGFLYVRVWACLSCAQEQIKQPEATGSTNNDWASHLCNASPLHPSIT